MIPNQSRRHDSPETYAASNAPHSSAANASVNDHGHKTVAIIALILASMSLMGMIFAIYVAREAKSEAQVATMRVEGMTRAMIKHGIKDTYPHVPGEDE